MSETELIINQISQQAKVLLQNHWMDISDFRNGADSMTVGFTAVIKYEGNRQMVETKIAFSKRVTDSIVDWIDSDQMKLDFPSPVIAPAKPRRGRPKKNLLERILTTAPTPAANPEPAS